MTQASSVEPHEPAALKATSLCEAFQATAAAEPDAVALRTPGGEVEISWSEYARRVEEIAVGLAALGISHGDTVALMMVNRPEFHLCDTAALHLGAVPFSIYNTLPAEQIVHLLSNAGSRVVICESQFADRLLEAGARAWSTSSASTMARRGRCRWSSSSAAARPSSTSRRPGARSALRTS